MTKKIMIVDDDPAITRYLEALFTDNGYETCIADDGKQAMDVFLDQQPDLITLDLEMPGEWGPRFYRKLAQEKRLKNIPVIVISGMSGIEHAIGRAVATINKPFDREKLLRIVSEILQ